MHTPPLGIASSTVISDACPARLELPLLELALLHDAKLDWPRWIKPRLRGTGGFSLPTACERWPNGHHPDLMKLQDTFRDERAGC
jgi:hypothetical protein